MERGIAARSERRLALAFGRTSQCSTRRYREDSKNVSEIRIRRSTKIIEVIEGLGACGQAGGLAGRRACVRGFGKLKGMKGIDGIAMASNKLISSFGGD